MVEPLASERIVSRSLLPSLAKINKWVVTSAQEWATMWLYNAYIQNTRILCIEQYMSLHELLHAALKRNILLGTPRRSVTPAFITTLKERNLFREEGLFATNRDPLLPTHGLIVQVYPIYQFCRSDSRPKSPFISPHSFFPFVPSVHPYSYIWYMTGSPSLASVLRENETISQSKSNLRTWRQFWILTRSCYPYITINISLTT